VPHAAFIAGAFVESAFAAFVAADLETPPLICLLGLEALDQCQGRHPAPPGAVGSAWITPFSSTRIELAMAGSAGRARPSLRLFVVDGTLREAPTSIVRAHPGDAAPPGVSHDSGGPTRRNGQGQGVGGVRTS
jgi:hypothetical protein